jgi:hypothetical protein
VNDASILAAVESKRDVALATHRFIHEHPELSHEERECVRYLCDVLEEAGLAVERGVAGMPTAFRATLTGGLPGGSVGLVALYNAVPVFRPDGTIEPVHRRLPPYRRRPPLASSRRLSRSACKGAKSTCSSHPLNALIAGQRCPRR